MTRADRITHKLNQALAPERLSVIDESADHAGHAGARPQGETHYRVNVVAAAFEGLTRVQRQRLVYDLLGDEFKSGLHALALATITPAEAEPS